MQHVVDQLEDGVIFLSREMRILFFNKAAEEVIGQPLEQAVGQPLAELLPASHPLRPLVEGALERGGGIRNATLAMAVGERRRECLVSAFPVEDAREVMGAVVLLKDLESIKTVQSLVSYSAKLAALGRLTSGVAHEVKNPLNAMVIHVELLEGPPGGRPGGGAEEPRGDRRRDPPPRSGRPGIPALHAAPGSRVQGHRPQCAARQHDARSSRRSGRPEASASSPSSIPRCPRSAPTTNCSARPSSIFSRMPVRRCRTAAPSRSARSASVGSRSASRFGTRASGSRADDLDKIFKLYYTTKPDGNGIGLSLVYRIIQLHDGAIEAESEVGCGTTMTVRLPVRSAP